MPRLTKEEIDEIATKYVKLRAVAEKTGKDKDAINFKIYQDFCIRKLHVLVSYHVKKYKKFSNYKDLEQDGLEALINALGTFNPNKGSFAWWASKYIKTRIVRNANAHSTIKFPMKTAKEIKPHKISIMPICTDSAPLPLENVEAIENSIRIGGAIKTLTDEQRQIVNMKYGFNGIREHSIIKILEMLSISRQQYIKLLSEAENQIRRHLLSKNLPRENRAIFSQSEEAHASNVSE